MRNLVVLLVGIAFISAPLRSEDEGFKPLFNGKDLTGWEGNPELWSVQDGCITGKTKGPDHLAYNQFLIWRGGTLKNFELRATIKQSGNNTGIQYRSKELPNIGKWSIGGYQCDIHPSAPNNGMVFEEKGRGIIARNGESVVLDPQGTRWQVAQREPVVVDIAKWHEYTIIAQGNRLIHKIDGQVTADLVDHVEKTRALEGLLAFQIHRGPAMNVQIKDVMLKELPEGGVTAFDPKTLPADAKKTEKGKAEPKKKSEVKPKSPSPAPANSAAPTAMWKWLWSDAPKTANAARLKKEFELGEGTVKEAVLLATCDNGAKVYLNGELVLTNPDWQQPTRAEVHSKLRAGKNELRVEATNVGGKSGIIAGLTLRMNDGSERVIHTDSSWLAAAPASDSWKPARIVASYGDKPWGDVFTRFSSLNSKDNPINAPKPKVAGNKKDGPNGPSDAISPSAIRTLPGFKVERIYTVPRAEQGSWVGLTVDDKGRLIASDQYGGLYRLTPPPIGKSGPATVEKLAVDIKGAHGLLYAFESLYVMVNEEPDTAGLWRLRDTNRTGQFDEKILLREIKGRKEHGNHSLTLSPDGKSIYISCGNGTACPEPLEHVRLSRPFADDQVVPRLSRGGDFSPREPHGFTCKVSPDGRRLEMVVAGLRNHFDVAFNAFGDLFTFDSDMEWDAGTPWYRPTRIYHLVSGGDYGFRESSGKLHEYCPDIVPPVINVGPGSPTGLVSGQGAAFPAKYQHVIFASDWTYGTLYAVHLTPEGAGYRGILEEFVSGEPLPLTDVVIGKDGAMYFTIGGRRTQSAVYRVTYTGKESTAPAPGPIETPEHKLRVELERLHDEGTGPEAIDKAWPSLSHPDRLVRWAARVAIERQPTKFWATRALQQTEPWAVLESGVALARMARQENQPALLRMLNGLEFGKLKAAQHMALIRVYQITISRSGLPQGESLAQTIARLDALFPAKSNDLNVELSRTLVALGAPSAVAKTLQLMPLAYDDDISWISTERLSRNNRYGPKFLRLGESRPNLQQIAYAYALRMAKTGWTPELRRAYFSWFPRTAPWQGGNQFRGFLDQILRDSLANVTDPTERKTLEALSKITAAKVAQNIVPPKGPGKNYTVAEVVEFAQNGLKGRDYARGRELFIASSCMACHRIGNEGGGVGPDLTLSRNRYNLRDLLENIIEPSKVISDQYESTIIELQNGKLVTGRVLARESTKLFVATNPAAPSEAIEIKTNEIESLRASPTSFMPLGLINGMNQSEVLDLLAYILSGGDPKNVMFEP